MLIVIYTIYPNGERSRDKFDMIIIRNLKKIYSHKRYKHKTHISLNAMHFSEIFFLHLKFGIIATHM